MGRWKSCPHCGASLPEKAAFCPHCARNVSPRREVKPPRQLPRRALYGALLILGAAAAGLSLWLYARPWVYDNGTAEVFYTDEDGTYQILAGYGAGRFEPESGFTAECEEGRAYRMSSWLYVNHQESGANAREVFLRKAASVTVDILQPEESADPWRCSKPRVMDFASDAAGVSLLDYTARSGDMELVWTITMQNRDVIRLHQQVTVRSIPARHYYPEDAPMGTLEELQALVDRIGAEAEPDTAVYLHLPPVTYQGGLTIGRHAVNLCGSEDGQGNRTTFTDTVRLSPGMNFISRFEGIDFVGSREKVGVSASNRLHLTDCRLSGWQTGLLGDGDAWVDADECIFEDNAVGFHFHTAGGCVSDAGYDGNIFRNNGTAVLLEQASAGTVLAFDGTRFTGNGTDIDNRCGQALSIGGAFFE